MQNAHTTHTMMSVLKSQLLLVDDHPLFRVGLALMIGKEPDVEVVAQASSPGEAIDLARDIAFDIAVIDVLMPCESGVSLATQLREVRPGCKILALSVLDEPTIIAMMLRAGAAGYALKTQPPEDIVDAIRVVLGGGRYLPPSVPADAVLSLLNERADRPLQRLTRRELEIFELLIRGYSNDEIATKLFIARRTVETHRQRIIKKLAAHSVLEMIRIAARQGALAH
jgi:DNA-binding NarL/FixJ family response regulator